MMGNAVPSSKLFCQILLMHFVAVCSDRVMIKTDNIIFLGHPSDPGVFFVIIPRIPVHFIAAQSSPCGHGQTDPVGFHLILDRFKGSFYVFCGYCVLGFEILMEDSYFLFGVIFSFKIQYQVQ